MDTITDQKAVIWDLDGVIADTGYFHFLSWQELTRQEGISFTEDDFRLTFGQRNPEILTQILRRSLSPEDINRLSWKKEELFRQLIAGKVKPLPGALELVRSLQHAGIKQGLASSTPRENIRLVLGSLGLAGFFEAIVSSEDVSRGKPHPEVFLLSAQKLRVKPGNCLVIEDAIDGVRAAKAAGMKCIAVTTTHPRQKLSEADTVVDSLTIVTAESVRQLLDSNQKDRAG